MRQQVVKILRRQRLAILRLQSKLAKRATRGQICKGRPEASNVMRKRTAIVLIVLFGAVVSLILFRTLPNREPEYQGKRLSAWFKQYYRSGQSSQRPDDPRREQAARALRAIGTNAIPFLVTECFTVIRESPVQTNVLAFLAKLPEPIRFPPFVPAREVQEQAASAIGEIKPPAILLLPLVTNRLNAPDKFQRWMATYLLGKVGEGGEAGVPFLREKLRSADVQESMLAALGLDRLGPMARLAVPDLIEVVRTNSFRPFSYYACRALARVGPAASNAIPVLKERLAAETNASRQLSLAVALVCIDSQQVEAMGFLQAELADNQKTNTHRAVIHALSDIGPNARPALPLLLAALKNNDPGFWHPALFVLLSLGETNLAISSALEKLKQDDPETRFNAMSFLFRTQPTNAAAMSNLVQLVQDPTWTYQAITEAARLGALAQPVIHSLRQIAADKTNAFRDVAKNALRTIEAEADEREAR